MVANIRGYTPNYNFKLINFDTPRWHTLEYANWSQLDSMLLAVGTPPIRGEWLNSTTYLIGDRVFDAQSSQLYRCLVEHTSATTGTFAEDRVAHPSYWMLQSAGVPVYRGAWLAGAAYVLGDIVKINNYTYYLCVGSHTSSPTFPPDAANWTLVFDATATVADSQAAATAAAASASAASSSESNAATSETNADASEAAASTSASSAATSATNAANSATTASTAATNAANSAATAANQAAALTGTSTTSNTITLGSKSFTTQAGKQFNVGNWMTIVDVANPTVNQMSGLITAYSGTALTVNVLRGLGSGTISNWALYVSGSMGADGATGTTTVTVSDIPPVGAPDGTMWWENDSGLLYVRYNDGNSTQWVIAAPQPDISAFVIKSGDTLTGPLTLSGNPTANLHAAPKQYVDAGVASATARYQRIALAGLVQSDVTVPTGAVAARLIGTLYPSTANSTYPLLQLSVAASVFRNTVGDYTLDGFAHSTTVTPTAVAAVALSSTHVGMLLSPANTNIALPIIFSATIILKRPNTTVVFACDSHASAWVANANNHSFYHAFLSATAAGSALSILALRVINGGGEVWGNESYVNVEWL